MTDAAPPAGWDTHVHVFEAGAPVRPGHYRPMPAPLESIQAQAAAHGIGHLVIVQPSVYGTDATVLLRALRREPGRHRGVAVVDADVSDAQLDELHQAGVRGVRFNRVSPAGHAGDPRSELRVLTPRLAARGWHVQWYVPAAELPLVAELQAQSGLDFVLDHLGGLHAALPADDPAWQAAESLARSGRTWVKLSGWYRLGDEEPYRNLVPTIRRVADTFGPRLLWGSDWPHTSFGDRPAPGYAALLQPLHEALGSRAAADIVRGTEAARLYD